jgi:UDP-N-acetylglucosamine acyltransferase
MIDERAIVAKSAKIADGVVIGPFTCIGENVEIGAGTWIGSHAVIKGTTKIGRNNKIYQFSSIGEDCQDKKYAGEETLLTIGDNNIFREGCTIHRGTVQGGGVTKIGNNNLFMVNAHVAHDCIIGNNTIFANGASIAGHVTVGDYASLGGLVGVHQFCAIGAHSFSAGGSIIYKDVMPFVKVSGYPAKAFGLNSVGLERLGFTSESLGVLKKAYKIIFNTSFTIKHCIEDLKPLIQKCSQVELMSNFIQNSSRGIVR